MPILAGLIAAALMILIIGFLTTVSWGYWLLLAVVGLVLLWIVCGFITDIRTSR